jgi:putative ABC transport system permease protein
MPDHPSTPPNDASLRAGWASEVRTRLASLRLSPTREIDIVDELSQHLDDRYRELMAGGALPDEARRLTLAEFRAGNVLAQRMASLRQANSPPPLTSGAPTGHVVTDLWHDLRYAGRMAWKQRGFSLLAVAIMALGIGANTAVFSVVNSVLLKPLPYPNADRIVALRTTFLARGESQALVSIANFRDWRDQSSSFEAMSSYRPGENSVTTGTAAEYGQIASVDAQFFRVFAVDPIIGRTFTPEEIGPGAPKQVLISHAYWQNRLASDARVLERTIRVGNDSRSIIGVLPAGFQFPGQTDVWLPQTTQSTSRTGHNLFAVGRLKPHVSIEQGQADLAAVAAGLEQRYPESNKGRGVSALRLQDELVGSARLTLYLLWGVVGVVLLIACANTATLLLGKAAARTREVAVRVALGANRLRIIRQLIAESLLLALAAGASGLLLAYWGTTALLALTPAHVMRHAHTGIDGGVLAFTLIVSIVTSLVFGLVPAFHASKVDLVDSLKQRGTHLVHGHRSIRTRGALVVSEIALAVVLLAGAGLVMKSLMALHRVELGFQPANVLVMKATGVRSRDENNAFFGQILSRVSTLPGVVAVGATSTPPGDLSNAGSGAFFVDRMPQQRDRTVEPTALLTIVAPGSFPALGIPLKDGRDFNEGDSNDRPLVAIVNESLVRQSFSGTNPIGRTIFCTFDRQEGMTIVGVVGDVRQRNPAIAPMPECYMPYLQHAYNNNALNILIRTAGDPNALASTVRRAAVEISPEVPVAFTTMDATVSAGVEDSRFRALLFGLFAALAVGLAMAGVYGVMAYAVEQRSKEIGVRMALGADQASVLRLILGQGLVLACAGLVLGLAGAFGATRLLETVLFQVRPIDIPVYLGVIALVPIVTLLAGCVPAWRAAIVNPVEVLKAE